MTQDEPWGGTIDRVTRLQDWGSQSTSGLRTVKASGEVIGLVEAQHAGR